jgi:hypothetical protein
MAARMRDRVSIMDRRDFIVVVVVVVFVVELICKN